MPKKLGDPPVQQGGGVQTQAGARKASREPLPGNLPARLSSFVPREREIRGLSAKLGSNRLVTLTGAPGVGKTSLALQVAHNLAPGFPDGAWMVELAGISRDGFVVQAVASALKISPLMGESLIDSIVSHLASRRLLLVLDNCEHLIGECTSLADLLLKSCPKLSLLATSQEALGFPGEAVHPVAPLSSPEGTQKSLAKLMKYEAVRLFADRAAGVKPDFRLDEQTGPAVAEICRRLDGIPLAIELAAARVALLSPAEILERLDDKFRLLAGARRAVLPRHRTLLASLEWSYDLLNRAEQLLLQRLGVFAGGFSLAVAEEVCSGGQISGGEVFRLVERLRARSLVMGDPGVERTRYRLLETVREFAWQKLSSNERHLLAERHAEWALHTAEKAEKAQDSPEEDEWMTLLDAEHKNMRSALQWYSSAGESEPAIRLTAALSWFWLRRGYVAEGKQWLEAALAQPQEIPDDVRASALVAAGSFATLIGDFQEALGKLEEGLSIYQHLDYQGEHVDLLKMIGMNQLFFHDPPTALPTLEKAVEHARKTGNPRVLLAQLAPFARAHLFLGEIRRAQEVFEEALAVAKQAGDVRRTGDSLNGIGRTLMLQGEFREAERCVDEGLRLLRESGDAYGTAVALGFAGELAAVCGDLKKAKALLKEALGSARSMGAPFPEARALAGLGRAALDEGQPAKAAKFFQKVISDFPTGGSKYLVPQCLLGLAEAAQAAGDWRRAASLADDALAKADENKDAWSRALCLYFKGLLFELQGKAENAGKHYHKALQIRIRIGDQAGAIDCLDGLASLAPSPERDELAVRLLGFCDSFREKLGYRRRGPRASFYETRLAGLHGTVSPGEFQKAWEQGTALSLDEAAAGASRGRGSRSRRSTLGWASLSPTELEVVSQIRAGFTNREIAERLFISPRTVESHLSRIFHKLGTKSRREVAKQADLIGAGPIDKR